MSYSRKMIGLEASEHQMKLIQMGALVKQLNSTMCYIKFQLDKIEVSYVYNINKKGKYFLERIKPYPLPIKEFQNEDDVIEIIKIDITQFKNACQSRNLNNFIDISLDLNKSIKMYEDLFLYYNVSKEVNEEIKTLIQMIQKKIIDAKDHSNRIYFEKEPDNL